MAEQPGMKVTGANALLLAGVAALAIAVFLVFVQGRGSDQAEIVAPASVPTGEEAVSTQTADAPVVEGPAEDPVEVEESVVAVEGGVTEAEVETPLEAAPIAPSFDLVRIDPTGNAVIAGSAEPGATVRLMAGEQAVAETVADASGKFVALFDLPTSAEPRSLSAEFDGADGAVVASTGTVLIAPTARPESVAEPVKVAEAEPAPVVEPEVEPEAAPEPTPDIEIEVVQADEAVTEPTESVAQEAETVVEVAPVVTEDEAITVAQVPLTEATPAEPETTTVPEVAEVADSIQPAAPVIEEEKVPEAPAEPESPAIVLADETGIKVLQPAPQPAAPKLVPDASEGQVANLVIDTITYDEQGDVALSGRGAGESFARVYVDDTAIKTVPIKPDGTWDAPLPEINAGIYKLRIDEVDSDGAVTSRVETPFQRETPEVVAEAALRPNAVTVQKGFTLWAIARDRFGDGTQYVRVYEANRDLIRDPDLIYPGQIFELPEEG